MKGKVQLAKPDAKEWRGLEKMPTQQGFDSLNGCCLVLRAAAALVTAQAIQYPNQFCLLFREHRLVL